MQNKKKIKIKFFDSQFAFKKFKFFISSVKDGLKNNKSGVKHNLFKGDDFSVSYCFLFAMILNNEKKYK